MKKKNLLAVICCCSIFYTQAQNNWTVPGPSSNPQFSFNEAMASLGGDKVLEFAFPGETWVYDLSDNTWTSMNPSASPAGRGGHVMVNIGGDKVLLFGGTSDFENFIPNNETWVYDLNDNTWTQRLPALSPTARLSTAMASAGEDHAILYAGDSGDTETWLYDYSDNAWTLMNPATNPGYQASHAMASLDEDRVLLEGVGDTWVYDLSDNTWTPMSPGTEPTIRYISAMASLGGDRVLLFGGLSPDIGPVNDTWLYDYGSNEWTMLSPSFSPSVRYGHGMAAITLDHVLMFGGIEDNATYLFTASPEPCPTEICNDIDDDCDGQIDEGVKLKYFADADNDGYGNPAVYQYDCEQPAGYTGTGTDCNDNNDLIYPDAPELPDGKDNDCDGLIDEGISVLNVEAGDCEVVYYGYAATQCVTLVVSAVGGVTPYTYAWSNGTTTPSTSVCPTTTTIYTVTVTDHNGNTAKDKVTVQVIDVRCGNNNDKVKVCHAPPGNPANVQTICVASSAVPDHLAHGDYLGICNAVDPCDEQSQSAVQIDHPTVSSAEIYNEMNALPAFEKGEEGVFSIYPNPANTYLQLELPGTEIWYEVTLYDVSGKLLLTQLFQSGKQKLSTTELDNGMYIIQIRSMTEKMTSSIVVLH